MARIKKIERTVGGKKRRYFYAYCDDRRRTPKEKSYPLRKWRQVDATSEAGRLQELYDQGRFDAWNPQPEHTGATLNQATEDFLESRRERRCRPTSLETYRYVLTCFAARTKPGGRSVSAIGAKDIRPYIHSDPLVAESTLRMQDVNLRAFY